MSRVVFITAVVTHYRVAFHEQVRATLAVAGVTYDLVYSAPQGAEAAKRDTVSLPWATQVPVRPMLGGRAVWQSIWPKLRGADLVVLGQENRFLHNYLLQLAPRALRPRIALWGHGRSFQARNPNSLAERWKRTWAKRADWWFGYTEETRRHIEALGFPGNRITVFNNSVDTWQVRNMVDAVTQQRLHALRGELGLAGAHVGVFVGGIYPDKRMAFLIEAADLIRRKIPDFELLVIGGGSDMPVVEQLAASRPWLHVMGPRFGVEKVELMMLGQLFLMPGLVGLAILDAGTAGLPMATTRFPWHSPEIAYLDPGVNGIMVDDWQDSQAYADAVVEVLANPNRLETMRDNARALGRTYTIEAMARNFSDGVLRALAI